MAETMNHRMFERRSFETLDETGYQLELLDNREDLYDWGYAFTLTGQCYGIGHPGGGNYAAEDVIRKSDLVDVISYWSRDENGEQYQTPFVGTWDVKLDSEAGQFFAYMDTVEAAEAVVEALDEWLNKLEDCYS
jgi:hypothetical protein